MQTPFMHEAPTRQHCSSRGPPQVRRTSQGWQVPMPAIIRQNPVSHVAELVHPSPTSLRLTILKPAELPPPPAPPLPPPPLSFAHLFLHAFFFLLLQTCFFAFLLHRLAHDFAFLASAPKPPMPRLANTAANPPPASRASIDRLDDPESASDATRVSKRSPSIPCLLAVLVEPRHIAQCEPNHLDG
jgi:hypothetical protein